MKKIRFREDDLDQSINSMLDAPDMALPTPDLRGRLREGAGMGTPREPRMPKFPSFRLPSGPKLPNLPKV